MNVVPAAVGRVSAGGRLGLLVVLNRPAAITPEGEAPFERLAAPEALVALLPNAFASTFDLPGALDILARLCVDTPTYRLDRLPINEAVAAIDAAVAHG